MNVMSKKIKFATGTVQKVTNEYYNLILKDQLGNTVYSATISSLDAAQYLDKYFHSITLIK